MVGLTGGKRKGGGIGGGGTSWKEGKTLKARIRGGKRERKFFSGPKRFGARKKEV